MTYKLTNTSQPADPYYGAVSLLLHGDGADGSTQIIDSSPRTKTVTAGGDAQISTAQSKFGGASIAFDGSGDYLSIPHDSDLSFAAGNFTIELWFYANSLTAAAILFLHRPSVSGQGLLWAVQDNGSLILLAGDSNTAAWELNYASAASVVQTGQWNHLALTRNGNQWNSWVNGVSVLTLTPNSFTVSDASGTILIGKSDAGDGFIDGYIDDLRITKGVARYTSNFTPPTQPFLNGGQQPDPSYSKTSLLLKAWGSDGSTQIIDSSFSPKTVTAGGDAQISTTESKFNGSSLKFDGTGDYMTVPNNADFQFDSGDFTIEGWIYPAQINARNTIVSAYGGSFNGHWIFLLENGKLTWYVYPSTVFNLTWTSTTTLPINQWSHVALTRQSNTWRLFYNGSIENTATETIAVSSSNQLQIGNYLGGNNFNGYIDDLRITKGIARYTSNFTPPGSLPTY